MPYLADTNSLLRIVNPHDPQPALVDGAVEELLARGEQIHYAHQNRREFWNVATRPLANNGFGLTPQEARERLRRIDALFTRLPDRADSGPEWDRVVDQYGIIGTSVHDAQLVASMVTHGLTHILTLNVGDFLRYSSEITPVHPSQVVKPPAPGQSQT